MGETQYLEQNQGFFVVVFYYTLASANIFFRTVENIGYVEWNAIWF